MSKKENKGLIFDIERFGLHDGPGIRTVFFFKGCPLKCLWCQNPEGQFPRPEIFFFKEKCLQCHTCGQICPAGAIRRTGKNNEKVIDRRKCTLCNQCVGRCPGNALILTGRYYTIDEVMAEVEKSSVFYRHSEGGITLSGGEPLLQEKFAATLLRESRDLGIHTAVETSGFVPWQKFTRMLSNIDLLLYDLKLVTEAHRACTGVSNRIIIDNLQRADNRDIPIIIRIPIVPGYTDRLKDLEASANLCRTLRNLKRVDLLPYHQMGAAKYSRLHRVYALKKVKPPTPEEMSRVKRLFASRDIETQVGG